VARVAIAWLLLALCNAAWADAEIDLRNSIQKTVSDAWTGSNFAALDDMADNFATTRARTFSGKWRLDVYLVALSGNLQIAWPTEYRLSKPGESCKCMAPDPRFYAKAEELWSVIDKKTRDWVVARPKSPHSVVARAQYLMNRAWFYRGGSYANDVPAEAWDQMRKYETLAQELLATHRDARLREPIWFEQMLNVAVDLTWSDGDSKELFEDFRKNGRLYPNAFQLVFNRLQRKWGGSPQMMDQFARDATELTRAEDGGAMYARLYWNVAQQYPRTVFSEAGADWKTMRAGFDDMVKQYPDPRNINAEAIFACMAGDVETMNKALARLGDKVQMSLWDRYVPYKECLLLRGKAGL
jgi:hypothetical protein